MGDFPNPKEVEDMKQTSGHEVLRSLDPGQKQRLVIYARNLSTDEAPHLHDDRMVDYLGEIVTDPQWLENQHRYLESLGWNQSMYSYKQIEEQLLRFTKTKEAKYFGWNAAYKEALEKMKAEARSWNLHSLTYHSKEDIVKAIPKLDTHAGFSFILTGKKYKGDYIEDLLDYYQDRTAKAKKEGSYNSPILIGTRTQANNPFDPTTGERENEFRGKSRLVSMIDIIQVLGESLTARPFQQKLSKVKWYAGGDSDKRIAGYIMILRKRYRNRWFSIDYSKYDQSISSWMIHDCFDIIQEAFINDANFDPEIFRMVRFDFINKCFIDGNGEIAYATKGVPSGSMYTQIVDSLANRLMIDSYMIQHGFNNYEMIIMGDDNLIYCTDPLDLESLSVYLDVNFGIEMNPTKCGTYISEGEDPQFLSRTWRKNGVYRQPGILLAKLVYPERFRDYKRNELLHPALIVDAYFQTFPLGMQEKFNVFKHRHFVRDLRRDSSLDDKWMTGLMRYRRLYLQSA